ncbi:MAG TPA: GGDEF domain-containing phosphodiesterase, partial [Gaiellales bacterium]|nr:GGDEF domain-containing phosphodiesterase [Gaiellales bacterium]
LAPFDAAGTEVFLGASVGIAVFPRHGTDAGELLRQADLAIYRSKVATRSGDGARRNALDPLVELSIGSRLHHAVETSAFELYYQPIVDLSHDRMVGVGALLRWNDRMLGPVAPADFIPVAERIGMMEQVSEWVLATACGQAAAWRRHGLSLRVAVNIPAAQRHPGFVRRALALIRESTCAADHRDHGGLGDGRPGR